MTSVPTPTACKNGGFDHLHPSRGGKIRCNRRLREKGPDAVRARVERDSRRRAEFVAKHGKTYADMTVDEQHEYQESTGGRALGRGERDRIRSEVIVGGRHIRHLDRGERYEKDCLLCEDLLVHCRKDGCWDGKEPPVHHLARHEQQAGEEMTVGATKG